MRLGPRLLGGRLRRLRGGCPGDDCEIRSGGCRGGDGGLRGGDGGLRGGGGGGGGLSSGLPSMCSKSKLGSYQPYLG